MDDRKKQISELEQRKKEQVVVLDGLLTRLGETLLDRVGDSFKGNDSAFEELAVFRRLTNDIADSEAAIQTVEEQIRRFREIEESIEAKEREDSAGLKELAIAYGILGKLLLDASSNAGDYANFCAPYRDQADALLSKALSLEDRLAGLEGKEGGNVFAWVGKNAQGLVLRSFLTKAQDNLEQLRRNVGERYSRRDTVTNNDNAPSEPAEIEHLCTEIERRRADARVLVQELIEFRDERRNISDSMNAEGGPLKQIKTLKDHIARTRDELKALYCRIGAEAAAIDDIKRRQIINSLIRPADKDDLDSAAQNSRLIHDDEAAIKKLQASLAIDEEKAKIEKYRKMIQDKKDKIVQAEKSIEEFETHIRVCEASIEKLQGENNGSKNNKKTSRKKNG